MRRLVVIFCYDLYRETIATKFSACFFFVTCSGVYPWNYVGRRPYGEKYEQGEKGKKGKYKTKSVREVILAYIGLGKFKFARRGKGTFTHTEP
jgi:hypothetical protein